MIERAAYSVRDLMGLYGVGRSTLYRDIAAGRLVAHKFGKKTVFFADDVTRWTQSWRKIEPNAMMGQAMASAKESQLSH